MAAYKQFMLMIAIRDYIKLQGRADLHSIAYHFGLPESAVTQMLSFWVNKGIIQRINQDISLSCRRQNCSNYSDCNNASTVIYAWL